MRRTKVFLKLFPAFPQNSFRVASLCDFRKQEEGRLSQSWNESENSVIRVAEIVWIEKGICSQLVQFHFPPSIQLISFRKLLSAHILTFDFLEKDLANFLSFNVINVIDFNCKISEHLWDDELISMIISLKIWVPAAVLKSRSFHFYRQEQQQSRSIDQPYLLMTPPLEAHVGNEISVLSILSTKRKYQFSA